ncbi:MerR family transcriptional regulator [Streptomyces sp. NPDC006356]
MNTDVEIEAFTIGEAAALFGLAPSTLRWWEKQGLVKPKRQGAARRLYGREELRRIALVHICRNMGLMPLDAITAVLDVGAGPGRWQETIGDHIETLDDQIRRITAARAYLTHMLGCRHDDPTRCPHLDEEIRRHTPWQPVRDERQETRRDERRPCPVCGKAVPGSGTGRPRTYCSNACRQRAHRARRRLTRTSPRRPRPTGGAG